MNNNADENNNTGNFVGGTQFDRRRFIGGAAIGAVSAVPYFGWQKLAFANVSQNDKPNIGCIGVGSMGTGDARGHANFGNIVAVCDVDEAHALRAKNDGNIGRGKSDHYGDYRRVLDRSDIDVVSIVTPDHWHIKIAVEALEAGKHVFCQKPLTLTLEENRLIRNACKKHPKQAFLVGTQQRSSRGRFLRAVNMVQKGLLGDIKRVTVGINGSPTGGPFPVAEVPKTLNWDMWQGQAPVQEYRTRRCHYEFRWWYEYSGGKFTDWGAHHVDIAMWALNRNAAGDGPVEVDGTNCQHPVDYKDGHALVNDAYNSSHVFSVLHKFSDGVVMDVTSHGDNGITFEGTKGKMFVNRGKITGVPIEENWDKDLYSDEDVVALYKGKPFEGHKNNFYRCVREGGLTVSDPFSHLQAMAVCHLSTLTARLGRKIQWDPKTEQVIGDDQANSFTSRKRRKGFEILKV
ncbi:MAG: Gfo/Idh/MocA family oxidoreductase [Planctomycetaceae bacterium]|jgi:predicted dehydrogenase|nr:Gfo/Idh/MocA family oxidoreductase [Planctomycetaceae bacterium]